MRSVPIPDELIATFADEVASRVLEHLAAQTDLPADPPWALLDLEKAAARLGRSTRWVRERVKRGELPYVRLDGGGLAFELDDLQSFARARRVSAGEPAALAGRLRAVGDPASAAASEGGYRGRDRRVGC